MPIIMSFGSIISMEWQSTAEGETILQHFYNPLTSGRKLFGILERPAVSLSVEDVSYKIFIQGGSGVGKTATVARLAGTKCPTSYAETLGIHKTNVYWPADAVVGVFSFADKNSFSELQHMISKSALLPNKPTILCIGTKSSSNNQEVTLAELNEFEAKTRIPVLKIENRWSAEKNEVHEVAFPLNALCERLWMRDQEYLLRQGLAR